MYGTITNHILNLINAKNNDRIIYHSDNGYRFIVIDKIPIGHNTIFVVNKYGLY